MCNLGDFYRDGLGGLKQDSRVAASWYSRAADAGNANAMISLGDLESDKQQAVAWFRKAADAGNTDAMQKLGDQYAFGVGPPKDLNRGLGWFQKAADGGNAEAMLGLCYLHRNGEKKDYKESLYWCRKAADSFTRSALAGDVRSMSRLGNLYKDGEVVEQDRKEAFSWYQKAAEAGDVSAMQNIAIMYFEGSVVTRDRQQAAFWSRKADGAMRAAGEPLAYLCFHRIGYSEEDKQEQRRQVTALRQAAEHSSLEAMLNLGYTYLTACSKDPKQAYFWFDKAAQSGSAEGMFYLGALYEIGDGVPKSRDQAISWYRKSAQLGEQYAKDALNRLGEDS